MPSAESMAHLSTILSIYWKADIPHPKTTTGFDTLFEETMWVSCGDKLTNGGSLSGQAPRWEKEYLFRLTQCLFNTIKRCLQSCYGCLGSFEPSVWPEITMSKVWPCMTNTLRHQVQYHDKITSFEYQTQNPSCVLHRAITKCHSHSSWLQI